MKLSRIAVISAVLVLGIQAVWLTSCDDEDTSMTGITPTPEATTSAGPTSVVFAEPTIVANLLTSVDKAYSVQFPEGWTITPNYAQIGRESLDVAFLDSAREADVIRPSLSVGCFPMSSLGSSSDTFAASRVSALTSTLDLEPIVTNRLVAGREATVVEYQKQIQLDDGQTDVIRQKDVFFASGTCGFTVSLLSSPADVASFDPQFDAMLTSFRILS